MNSDISPQTSAITHQPSALSLQTSDIFRPLTSYLFLLTSSLSHTLASFVSAPRSSLGAA
ncbi:hypothetical protein [uncultured Prevotella sp.]|uniref:hypothetical protein n=1 Tax=uncultured Prevotella sp. TaxID=159272 RepID=UPI00258AF301|nr:hypothetical protein [uncultured Prevotella sp.]